MTIQSCVHHNGIQYAVTSIGNVAFCGEIMLREVILPASVENIGSGAFFQCSSLRKVTVPSVRKINNLAFSSTKLTTVNLPNTLTELGWGAFRHSRLKCVEIPGSLSVVRHATFADCDSIQHITIHEGVKVIEDDVFTTILADSLILPSSLRYFGKVNISTPDRGNTGSRCRYVRFLDGPQGQNSVDTLFFSFREWNDLQEVYIPNNVNYGLLHQCFRGTAVSTITLPEGLAVMYDGTFESCSNLRVIEIPEGLEEIPANAFGACWNLKHITLPASLNFIGSGAFQNVGLDTVTLHSETPPELSDNQVFFSSYGNSHTILFEIPCNTYLAYNEADNWVDLIQDHHYLQDCTTDFQEYEDEVKLYPVPARNSLTVKSEKRSVKRVDLYDMFRRFVCSQPVSGYNAEIDFSAMPSGMVLLRIFFDDGRVSNVKTMKQ